MEGNAEQAGHLAKRCCRGSLPGHLVVAGCEFRHAFLVPLSSSPHSTIASGSRSSLPDIRPLLDGGLVELAAGCVRPTARGLVYANTRPRALRRDSFLDNALAPDGQSRPGTEPLVRKIELSR